MTSFRGSSRTFAGRTAVLRGKEEIAIETYADISPLPADCVRVKVMSVGICGSDLSYFFKGEIAGITFDFPNISSMRFAGVMGHEASGVVIEVGSSVSQLSLGDRVALEPGVPCGDCRECLGGKYNLCPSVLFLGSFISNHSGALTESIIHPARWCHPIPASLSFDSAALVEPLAVAVHSLNRGGVTMGDKLLIVGAGAVGLLVLAAARLKGIFDITIVDINEYRLNFAREKFGASKTYQLPQQSGDIPADHTVVIECTGVGSSVDVAFTHTRRGGTVVLVGTGHLVADMRWVQLRELNVLGVFRYRNVFPTAIQAAQNIPNLDELVSHRFALENVSDAFFAAKSDPHALKVVIHPNMF